MRGRLAASVVVVVVVGWVAVLVLTASVAVLVLAAVSLRGQTASTLAPVPGPVIGLRLPLYDYSCGCYRYLKLDPGQTQIAPDPAGTSNGIWSVKLYAAPGTADAGRDVYVGGPTGAIVVDNSTAPPQVDIATSVVPRKATSETIPGVWTFTQGFVLGPGAPPECGPATRGRVVMVRGGDGIEDVVGVCAKSAAGFYGWKVW